MGDETKKSKGGIKYFIIFFIVAVIFYFVFIAPSKDSANSNTSTPTQSNTNVLEEMKSHIVYVTYDYSGKDSSGNYFENKATGSGVIFYTDDSTMQIFTNRHVIDCGYTDNCYQRLSENVKVRMPDGKTFNASRVSIAPHGLDISVLTIDGNVLKSYSPTPVRKNELQLGEKVTAIGYPALQGINNVREFSISDGTITNQRDMLMDDGFSFKAIDSDAYINHGSSGGGLFDAGGNLIGITTWKSVGVQESTAININVINNFDSYSYCQEGSYPLGNDKCAKYCKREEVLGSDGICYGVCKDFYCKSQTFNVNDPRCKDGGQIAGDDGYCHNPCESQSSYCTGNGFCYKNKCVSCPSANLYLYEDGICRVYQ